MRALTESPTNLPPMLVRPEEAARIMGVGRTSVYALMAAGDLRSVQIGRSRRIPITELERYIAERLESVGAGD